MKILNFVSWSPERISFLAKSHFPAEFPVSGALLLSSTEVRNYFGALSIALTSIHSVTKLGPIPNPNWDSSWNPKPYTHPPTNYSDRYELLLSAYYCDDNAISAPALAKLELDNILLLNIIYHNV